MTSDPHRPHFIRALNPTEKAFAITNLHFPLCVTIVLRLRSGPDPEQLAAALSVLQERHLLLNAGINHGKGGWYFYAVEEPKPIPLSVVVQETKAHWMEEVERALNQRIPMEGPLMKAVYLWPGNAQDEAEILLSFHHSFVDSIALRLILHELLSHCGGQTLPEMGSVPSSASVPRFPARYRGVRLIRRLLPFIGRQMADEWRYFRKGKSKAIPEDSHNAIINLQLSEAESKRLMEHTGRKGLSLNSVLNAALLLSYKRRCYGDALGSDFRTIAFANLRPYVVPEPPPDHFGCFISMLRFSLPVEAGETLVSLAAKLNQGIFKARRRGELQLFSLISRHLVSLSMAAQKMRLSNTALSYMGLLELEHEYGAIALLDVHAYITNNKLGAEFSGFAKVLFGRIEMDFSYLTSETDRSLARLLVKDMQEILRNFC